MDPMAASATHLPTFVGAAWAVTGLRDSILTTLPANNWGTRLSLFFYAVTELGWRELREAVMKWKATAQLRHVIAYVGTDHAITEPEALKLMQRDGVDVRLLQTYQGVFHPKVIWLTGEKENSVWVGSNNLTRDALLHNVEFAVQINSVKPPPELVKWAKQVAEASTPLTYELIRSYECERRSFATTRSSAGTFTWTKRKEPQAVSARDAVKGDLIIEVMPLETGLDGKQIQLPKAAAVHFFGLPDHIGASRRLALRMRGETSPRTLTMTIFANNSVRLSINELDYRHRPCVMTFRRLNAGRFEFDIVQRSIFPTRYNLLLKLCNRQTRAGSRRWTVVA